MEILMWPLPSWITDTSSLLSIVGFALTIMVFIETKSLKKIFKRKVRIPQIHNNLMTSASNINEALKEWDNNQNYIRQQFYNCAVYAESLSEKISSRDRSKINDFLDEVKPKGLLWRHKIHISLNNFEQAWALYEHLSTLNVRLDEIIKDMRLD